MSDEKRTSAYHSTLVASGILLSKIFGFVRERVFAAYLGNSEAADAFRAALRIPNFLQNLFGEGILSASFIPVYSSLLARGDRAGANRVAGTILSLLFLISAVLVLLGVWFAPLLVAVLVPGFDGERRELTTRLVAILFPAAGLLVLSAWCLGILNSHRRFFIPYAAPVLWNLVIIFALVFYGRHKPPDELVLFVAWGVVVGSLLQLLVQVPAVLRSISAIRPTFILTDVSVRTVLKNFFPVVMGRGVVQISAYVDNLLASLLAVGSVAALSYAQTIYLVPISLFGLSTAAAQLPTLSSLIAQSGDVDSRLKEELIPSLARVAFYVIPSALLCLLFGDVLAGILYQTGRFSRADSIYVWSALAGASVGLLSASVGRLYAAVFYAFHDTKTPVRFAVIRVFAGSFFAYLLAVRLPPLIGVDSRWGIAGLTLGSAVAAWIECFMLRRALAKRLGGLPSLTALLRRLWIAGLGASVVATLGRVVLTPDRPILYGAVVLALFSATYLLLGYRMRINEALIFLQRVKLLKRSSNSNDN